MPFPPVYPMNWVPDPQCVLKVASADGRMREGHRSATHALGVALRCS